METTRSIFSENIADTIRTYTVDACKAVKIIFVCPFDHIISDAFEEYEPAVSHQIFGPNEEIFGYKDLKIKIVYSESSGHCYVNVSYSSKVTYPGLVPDDVWSKLSVALPSDYVRDSWEFSLQQQTDSVINKFFGVPRYRFFCSYGNVEKGFQYRVFTAHLCSLDESGFRDTHQRFQTLLLWYIDAANFIDLDDPNWNIIYLYTSHAWKTPALVGFCTFYKFYAYPDLVRARISQFIVFPKYQRSNIGLRFLRCVYRIIRDSIPNLKDIAVEDPNVGFRVIRGIANFQDALISPAMEKFLPKAPQNFAFEGELRAILKLTKKDSEMVADMMQFLHAAVKGYDGIRTRVFQRVQSRFRKEVLKSGRHKRDSVKYRKQLVTDEALTAAFTAYWSEFTKIGLKIADKCGVNMTISKIN